MVMIQMNVSHTDTTLWIFYTSGSSYKDEQYLTCLCREENHTTTKITALEARQLYTACKSRLLVSRYI